MKPAALLALALLAPVAAHAAATAPAAASQPASRFPEPVVHERIIQDRAVRIREEQVRGATTRIEVQPLHGGAPYRVVPPDSATHNDPADMQGHAQWTIRTFN